MFPAELRFALNLRDFCALDAHLRNVCGFEFRNAFLAGAQVLAQRLELRVPHADFIRAQDKQLRACGDRLRFGHAHRVHDRLVRRLDRVRAVLGH